MKKSEIKAWAQEFKFTVPSDILMDSLGAEYKKMESIKYFELWCSSILKSWVDKIEELFIQNFIA